MKELYMFSQVTALGGFFAAFDKEVKVVESGPLIMWEVPSILYIYIQAVLSFNKANESPENASAGA